ncbi:hypothetical protein [Nocardia barduliensis]|uniref:hypothetical protein n=1 Tax=Nocardia barduliensis TaxID=2736643 RepID=UPI0015725CF0|nr:hypothetical protein [Nocardia barduliensis]
MHIMRRIQRSLVVGTAAVAAIAAVSGTASANTAERDIEWTVRNEGRSVVAEVDSGRFRVAGNALELVDDAGALVLQVPLALPVNDTVVALAVDYDDHSARLTPVTRVAPSDVPVAPVVTPVVAADEIGLMAVPAAIAMGSTIGSAIGGVLGLIVGCAVGAAGTLAGCAAAGAAAAGTGATIGGVIGAGIGAIVGALAPAP